jgi:hypothetical protein
MVPLWLGARIIVWERRATAALTPPAAATTLQGFAAWQQTSVRYVSRDDAAIVIALVSFHESERLASGPAAYVFNENGRLVDWTVDMGDDSRFQSKWPIRGEDSEISLSEAVKLTSQPAMP